MDVLNPGVSVRTTLCVIDDRRLVLHDSRRILIVTPHSHSPPQSIETTDSIGAISISSNRSLLAVGGKNFQTSPSLTIYETKDITQIKTLSGGAALKYDAIDFNADASILATVSGEPDYSLTLWNWRDGNKILRSKAFSQEIFRVRFSKQDPSRLITCGTGHIKFWTVSDTFTGMKLQGGVGKFGKVELTDIYAFTELSDGYTISGTESGDLLLWKDCLVKCIVRRSESEACHGGTVNVVQMHLNMRQLVTAAADGWIKIWNADDIVHSAQKLDGGCETLCLMPTIALNLKQVCGIADDQEFGIANIDYQHHHWIVSLTSGGLIQMPIPTDSQFSNGESLHALWEYASGSITGIDLFHFDNAVMTASTHGTIALYDLGKQKLLYRTKQYSSGSTCLACMPTSEDKDSSCLCVAGFKDGTVRSLKRSLEGLKLTSAMRPHKAKSIEKMAVTGCSDGRIFFYSITTSTLHPIGFVTLPQVDTECSTNSSAISTGCFDSAGAYVIATTRNGSVFKIVRPLDPDSEEAAAQSINGYEIDTAIMDLRMDTFFQERHEQLAVAAIHPWRHNVFFVTFTGDLIGEVYLLSIEDSVCERVGNLKLTSTITSIQFVGSRQSLVLGTATGEVCIMCPTVLETDGTTQQWERHSQYSMHDAEWGAVTNAKMTSDGTLVVSAAKNGTLVMKRLGEETVPNNVSLPDQSEDGIPEAEDIVGSETFSLDEAKSKEMQRIVEKQAELKKKRILSYIRDLSSQFQQIKEENKRRPVSERIPDRCLEVDKGLQSRMYAELQQSMKEAEKEYIYSLEKASVALKKLQQRFIIPIEQYSESVTGIGCPSSLSSFEIRRLEIEQLEKRQRLHGRPESASSKDNKESQDIDISIDRALVRSADGRMEVNCPSAHGNDKGSRCQSRKLREKLMEQHRLTKPEAEDYDNAKSRISDSTKAAMKDFKLKTSVDDDVLLQKAIKDTPLRKEYQLSAMEGERRQRQIDFNIAFEELKRHRETARNEIEKCNAQLRALRQRILETTASDSHSTKPVECRIPFHTKTEITGIKDLATNVSLSLEEATVFLTTQKIPANPPTPADTTNTHQDGGLYKNKNLPQLLHIQSRVVQKQKRIASRFNAHLSKLVSKKRDIECANKCSELKEITLRQEVECLLSLHPVQEEICLRTANKQSEIENVQQWFEAASTKLNDVVTEDNFTQGNQELREKFDKLISTTHPQRDILSCVFLKKPDKQPTLAQDIGSDASDSDEEILRSLDKDVLKKLFQLREERRELEDRQSQHMKEIDSGIRETDLYRMELVNLEGAMESLHSEMRQFQAEKLQRLNAMHSCVVLRPSQIETPLNGSNSLLDQDVVLLDCTTLASLTSRPKEMEQERSHLKSRYQTLRQHVRHLGKDKETKQKNLDNLKYRLEEMQMLKYGQILDLEALDAYESSSRQSQRHASLHEQERDSVTVKELQQLNKKIDHASKQLYLSTEINTEWLTKIANYKRRQIKQDRRRKKDNPSTDQALRASLTRKQKLIDGVKGQAQTIVELKRRLQCFKQKHAAVHKRLSLD